MNEEVFEGAAWASLRTISTWHKVGGLDSGGMLPPPPPVYIFFEINFVAFLA